MNVNSCHSGGTDPVSVCDVPLISSGKVSRSLQCLAAPLPFLYSATLSASATKITPL